MDRSLVWKYFMAEESSSSAVIQSSNMELGKGENSLIFPKIPDDLTLMV